MVGRTNAGAGIKKLEMAKAEKSAAAGKSFYITVTCDFDPLVITVKGPDGSGESGNEITQTNWRLTKNSDWEISKGVGANIISLTGRTIKAGPFEETSTGALFNGQVLAYGFPD